MNKPTTLLALIGGTCIGIAAAIVDSHATGTLVLVANVLQAVGALLLVLGGRGTKSPPSP